MDMHHSHMVLPLLVHTVPQIRFHESKAREGVLRFCDTIMKYSSLVVSTSLATLVNSCGIPFIGFQSASVSFIGCHWVTKSFRSFYNCLALYPWRCSCLSFGAFCPIFVLSGSAITSLGYYYLIPRSFTSTKQNRAFSAAGPSIWNSLPFELRSLPRDFSSSFYSLLKTFLFARAWERF